MPRVGLKSREFTIKSQHRLCSRVGKGLLFLPGTWNSSLRYIGLLKDSLISVSPSSKN